MTVSPKGPVLVIVAFSEPAMAPGKAIGHEVHVSTVLSGQRWPRILPAGWVSEAGRLGLESGRSD